MHRRHTPPSIGTTFSIAAHVLVLGALILAGHQAWKVRTPQERGGDRTVLYWQGPPAAALARPRSAPLRKTSKSLLKAPNSRAQVQRAVANRASDGLGTSSQDITPAFPVFSPSPHLADRSLLPPSTKSVVVDVNVSAQGEVSDEKLVQGLGNNVDQIILDTVKTWKFHPASSDGNAVASVAELVFPLSPKWRG
jgi:TonB family protein